MKKDRGERPTADEIVDGMGRAIDRDRGAWASLEGTLRGIAAARGRTVAELSGDPGLEGVVLTYGEEAEVHRAYLEVMKGLRVEGFPISSPAF